MIHFFTRDTSSDATNSLFGLVVYVKSVYNVTLVVGDMLFAPLATSQEACLKLGALKPSMEHVLSVRF